MPDPATTGHVYAYAIAHVPAEMMAGIGIPEEAHKVGVFGLVTAPPDRLG